MDPLEDGEYLSEVDGVVPDLDVVQEGDAWHWGSLLVHSRRSAEEEVPLDRRYLLLLFHYLHTHHEGEYQLVLLKQASGKSMKDTYRQGNNCEIKIYPTKNRSRFVGDHRNTVRL